MKKIIYNAFILMSLSLAAASCMKIDNIDGPDSHMTGNIIDAVTKKNILADQGECRVRIFERSYSDNPAPQDIPLKQDGTYNNTKLFSGDYDVVPEGAWWPCDTAAVKLKGTVKKDFEVTPYLSVIDFKSELNGTTLNLSCRIDAPIKEGLPQIIEIRPYLSRTQFCGANNKIDYYYSLGNSNEDYCKNINKTWDELPKAEDGKSQVFNFKISDLKPGYIYFVRIGAKVRDNFQNCNYSDIIKVEVP